MSLSAPVTPKLEDEASERVRREFDMKIRELQTLPAALLTVTEGIELKDATETPIAHGLSRKPRLVIVSPPRGATATGRIEEVRSGSYDRARVVVLKATGHGATITVDLGVL